MESVGLSVLTLIHSGAKGTHYVGMAIPGMTKVPYAVILRSLRYAFSPQRVSDRGMNDVAG